jgi:3-oxoacid CoA-transferase A subunit
MKQTRNKVVASFAEAVADIPDGASILIGGFGTGTPHNLVNALHEQGAKDLTLILNAAGTGGGGIKMGRVSVIDLLEERRVRKVIMAFTASTHPSRKSILEELQEAGELDAELVAQGTLAERIRAGGAGIPAFFTPTGVGTRFAEGKEERTFDGRRYIMERSIKPDYALVRALRADKLGNLYYRNTARAFNPPMAMAATCTIAEVEEVVEPGEITPDLIATPGIYVHRLVVVKR